MKELSTENKTELYDNLIERLKDFQFDYRFSVFSDAIERYFPELKESKGEDEGIKGAIIEHLKDNNLTEWASWLEKQNPNVNKAYWRGYREGKQEILDKYTKLEKQEVRKVKPKFHEDEWITNGDYIWKIVMVKSLDYILQSQGGNIVEDTISHVDEQFHSFTIKDAKDGDVLASKDGHDILIFRRLDVTTSFSSYYNLKGRGELGWTSENFIPATKEQRDLLFQKMKEEGYEWDADKKELKEIDGEYNGEDYGIDGLYHAQRILEKTLGKVEGYQTDDGILSHQCAISAVKKLYEQKPIAWNEGNEKNFNEAISYIKDAALRNWLKSLKDKVAHPKNA